MSISPNVTYVRVGDHWEAPGRTPLGIVIDRNSLVRGTYEPDATTAGVIAGIALTPKTTQTGVTVAGTTWANTEFLNSVNVNAADVTFTNCIFRGEVNPISPGPQFLVKANNTGVVRLKFIDCLFEPQTPVGFSVGVNGHDYTTERCEFNLCCDGMQVYNTAAPGTNTNVKVYASWFHDLIYGPDINTSDDVSHADCIQLQGGANNEIIGNSMQISWNQAKSLIPPPTTGSPTSPGYLNGGSLTGIMFNNNVGVLGSQLITDNWFRGGNVPINMGAANGAGPITMLRNKFDRAQGGQSTGGDATLTIIADATTNLIAGEGTANANRYIDNGHEVTVRRNW